MAKSSSKLLVSIIAFLLGFIFAILAEIGAIVGVYVYVTTQDLDTILAAVGLPNRDENGNNRYVNTDSENGGASNLKELFERLKDLLYENGELSVLTKSFGDFEQLLPATNILLGMIYDTIGEYVDLDHEKFESSPMTELAQVISDSVMSVHIGTLLEKLNSDLADNDNVIVKSLLLGAETEYATVVYSGATTRDAAEETAEVKFPVLYDIYTFYEDLGWFRDTDLEGKSGAFPDNIEYGFIDETTVTDKADGEELTDRTGKLFYIPCKVTETSILPADYKIDTIEYEGKDGNKYFFQQLYYDEGTDFIAVKANADGKYVLNHAEIWGASGANPDAEPSYRYPGYSYDEDYGRNFYIIEDDGQNKPEQKTISGKNYFRNSEGKAVQYDPLTMYDLINNTFDPLYSVAVTEVVKEDADVAHELFGKTTLGDLLDGNVKFNTLIDNMEVSSLIGNVKPSNKLMAYMVFKLSDLKEVMNEDGEVVRYTATYDKFGENLEGVTVNLDEKGNIDSVYNGEILLEGVKVNKLAEQAEKMTLNILMDVSADDAITSYVAYGIYGIRKATDVPEGSNYTYTGKVKIDGNEVDCFISTPDPDDLDGGKKPIISSAWYLDEDNEPVFINGTKVSNVSERVGDITKTLTVGEIINVKDSKSQLLNSIKDTKINDLGTRIENITIGDIFTKDEIDGNTILRVIGDVRVDELAEAIDNVLIQRLYAEKIYGLHNDDPENKNFDPKQVTLDSDHEGEEGYIYFEEFDESLLYYEFVDGTFKLVKVNCEGKEGDEYDDELGHLTAEQYIEGVENGAVYYTYGEATAMWKLILSKGGREHAYTINNFHGMVESCRGNIYKASLRTLHEAGIITGIDESKLDGKIGDSKPIGEWSLQELITYVLNNLVTDS